MGKNGLTRRDFLKVAGITSAGLALSACGVKTTELPTSTATATLIPSPVPSTTPSSTPIPMIQAGEISVPDPKITNPELFNLQKSNAPIPQFVSAMNRAGIMISPEQVMQGIVYKDIKDINGNLFVVAIYTIDHQSSSNSYPILMGVQKTENKEWGWREATRGELGDLMGILVGVAVSGWMALQDKHYERIILSDTNHFQIDDLSIWSVLEPESGKLNKTEFQKFYYAVSLAKTNNKTLSVGQLIWGYPDFIPDWVKKGNYSKEELLSIAENHIETFLAPYKDDFQRVTVANEVLPHLLNIPHFWIDTNGIGRDLLLNRTFRKAREVVPNMELALREYSVEFAGYPRADEFFNLVSRLNDDEMKINGKNLIDAVEFQLPLLLPPLIGKDPAMNPSNFVDTKARSKMMEKLGENIRRFHEIGVSVYITELFIPTNNLLGTTEEKLILQANIYADIFRVCVKEGAGITIFRPNDSSNPTYAYPPPENTLPYPRDKDYEPLPSYYAINEAIILTTVK